MATQPLQPPLPSYSVAVPAQPQQTVYVMGGSAPSSDKYLRMIKRTSIIQIVGGVLLVCFGIICIILLAQWSYFATPMWMGLVFFCLTGCIGLRSASTGSLCLIGTYIAMSVLSCLAGFVLLETYVWAAIYEQENVLPWYSDYEWNCQPGGTDTYITNCAKSEAARQAFDALIAFTGFFSFVLCIVAASFGCCAACACCRQCCSQCCSPPQPPTTAYYTPNGGAVVAGQPNMLQGGTVSYMGQPGNFFVVQPNLNGPYPPPGGALPGYQMQNQPSQQQLQQQPMLYPGGPGGNPGQGPAVYPMPPVQEPAEEKTGPLP